MLLLVLGMRRLSGGGRRLAVRGPAVGRGGRVAGRGWRKGDVERERVCYQLDAGWRYKWLPELDARGI